VGDLLHCVRFAAEVIADALSANDPSAPLFRGYEERVRRGAGVWQGLVSIFYEAAPLFSRLIAESNFRLPAMRLCEGDVYSPEAGETLTMFRNAPDSARGSREYPKPNHSLSDKPVISAIEKNSLKD